MLIIGLVIFSHSIIPHDHHYDIVTDIDHEEHHGKDKSGHEPIHCHYFNDVVISKVSISVQQPIKQILKIIGTISSLEIDYRKNTFLKAIFFSDFIFPEYFAFLDTSPTRGSPLS